MADVPVNLPIVSVSLFERKHGTDVITLNIAEDLQRKIFGKYYKYAFDSGFRIDVPKGTGHSVIKELGMEHLPIQAYKDA